MRWRRNWPEREPRPKAQKLSEEEKAKILSIINNSITASPVLTALNYRIKLSRGRFYYEQVFPDGEIEIIGRVTPLADPDDEYLLEVEYGKNNWKRIKQGKIRTITNVVSGDKRGTFHGLGALNKSIRASQKNKSDKLKVLQKGKLNFYYADSDKQCRIQEVLFHYFDVPIPIIAKPREWYAYHRTPYIKEIDEDKNAVLVQFMATSMKGGTFGGTCLYIRKDDKWEAFRIRPNQSDTIETSIQWLAKRKWRSW